MLNTCSYVEALNQSLSLFSQLTASLAQELHLPAGVVPAHAHVVGHVRHGSVRQDIALVAR